MSKIILITGGCRSGKSFYAMNKALKYKGIRYFFATATPFDKEMQHRIAQHKKERNDRFKTVEVAHELAHYLKNYLNKDDGILLVDCLTVWIGNLMHHYKSDLSAINEEIERVVNTLPVLNSDCILVTNEVGMGIVPENKMAREFRDLSGLINRKIAEIATEVYITVCGIPLKIK